jgi:hypothetical protein
MDPLRKLLFNCKMPRFCIEEMHAGTVPWSELPETENTCTPCKLHISEGRVEPSILFAKLTTPSVKPPFAHVSSYCPPPASWPPALENLPMHEGMLPVNRLHPRFKPFKVLGRLQMAAGMVPSRLFLYNCSS